jgi:hypothetical protein
MTPNRDGETRLEGRYANYFKLGFDRDQFVLDFGQSFSEDVNPCYYVRIVTNPAYAEVLRQMLSKSLQEYEKEFGRIPSISDPA